VLAIFWILGKKFNNINVNIEQYEVFFLVLLYLVIGYIVDVQIENG
jgi:hypothetical protein